MTSTFSLHEHDMKIIRILKGADYYFFDGMI